MRRTGFGGLQISEQAPSTEDKEARRCFEAHRIFNPLDNLRSGEYNILPLLFTPFILACFYDQPNLTVRREQACKELKSAVRLMCAFAN